MSSKNSFDQVIGHCLTFLQNLVKFFTIPIHFWKPERVCFSGSRLKFYPFFKKHIEILFTSFANQHCHLLGQELFLFHFSWTKDSFRGIRGSSYISNVYSSHSYMTSFFESSQKLLTQFPVIFLSS